MATRYDPFQEMERFVSQALGAERSAALMPLDLYRAGDRFVAHIDLPGADPDSIDVNVEDRSLTVRAERKPPVVEGAQWLVKERGSGTYARTLTLGRGLALDHVEASYTDGVLTLVIPVAEEAKPRRIEVKREAARPSIEGMVESS